MADHPTIPEVQPIEARGYANPDVLVSTDWVASHLNDPNVRLIEANEDVLLYETGHIPGAVKLDWVADLNDPVTRDYVDSATLQRVLRSRGINQDTTIVLYGDKNNWWAAYSFWVLKLFGLENLKIMDGGRARWEQEGRPLTTEIPQYPEGNIVVGERDDARIRAFRDDVLALVRQQRGQLVDVRSPEEYRGERLHMPDYPNEGALRGGHIPGAVNVPWSKAVNPDGTFKSAEELRRIYEEEQGLQPDEEIITYCRIGERSSHTWFVLKYLLGYERVRNYDGSWTEWGNLVNVPIER